MGLLLSSTNHLKQLKMKKMRLIFTACLFLIGVFAFAQDGTKVIALVTKASWCPVCKKNGDRMAKEVFSSYMDGKLKVVMNDVSDENTKKESQKEIENNKIGEIASKSKSTGIITLIDIKTGKVVSTISVGKSTEKVKKAIDAALAKA